MEVTVSKWTPKHDGNLVGFGDVIVNNTVEIRGCALRKGKEGNLWVSVPSRKYSNDHYRAFQEEAIKALTAQDNDQRFSNDDDMPF